MRIAYGKSAISDGNFLSVDVFGQNFLTLSTGRNPSVFIRIFPICWISVTLYCAKTAAYFEMFRLQFNGGTFSKY